MTKDLYCQICSMTLPIGANYNRKFCNSCRVIHNKEVQREKYQTRKKKHPIGKEKSCTICAQGFLYKQSVGRSRDICPNCVDKYLERVLSLVCLLCGKKLEQNAGRGRFAFCSVEHSKPAWYILRRYKKGALTK